MIQTQISFLDAAVLSVMLLSSLFAFFRGFVREVLSLGAWIGAGLVTIYYFPSVSEAIRPHFKNETGAVGVSTLGIYTIALISFSLVNMLIMKFVKSGSDVGMLDNMLGFFFGAFRGGVIIAMAFFIMTIFIREEKDYPKWLTEAVTYPYVERSAVMLTKVAPKYLQDISGLQKKIHEDKTPSDITIKNDSNPSAQAPSAGVSSSSMPRQEGQ